MAVFTPLSHQDIESLCLNYGLGALGGFEPVAAGIENTNYKINTASGRFILTVVEKRTPEKDLPFIVGVMRAFAQEKIPAPRVIDTLHGGAIAQIHKKPVLVTAFLDGADIKNPTPAQTAAAGAMLGRMHIAGAQIRDTRTNPMCPAIWQNLLQTCRDKNAPLAGEILQHAGKLAGLWTRDLPRGAVHADYFKDNVFFNGDTVCGVIDFYFSCTEMMAYDLMIAVNDWAFNESGILLRDRLDSFIGGYQSARPLTAAERDALPALGMAAAARIIATRLYDGIHHDPSKLVTPKDPAPYKNIFDFHAATDILAA